MTTHLNLSDLTPEFVAEMVRSLRATGEEEMYQAPASTKRLIDVAADMIERLGPADEYPSQADRDAAGELWLDMGNGQPEPGAGEALERMSWHFFQYRQRLLLGEA